MEVDRTHTQATSKRPVKSCHGTPQGRGKRNDTGYLAKRQRKSKKDMGDNMR